MQALGKIVVLVGLLTVGLGLLMMLYDKIPFLGKLPGDVNIRRDNFQLFVPISSSILISLVISLVVWLISFMNKK